MCLCVCSCLTSGTSPHVPHCWCGCCVSPVGRCSWSPSWRAAKQAQHECRCLCAGEINMTGCSALLRVTRSLTSCFKSSSDSPAKRYLCCSNSYLVVFVTTATFSGLNPALGCDEVWRGRGECPYSRRAALPPSHISFTTEPRLIVTSEHRSMNAAEAPATHADSCQSSVVSCRCRPLRAGQSRSSRPADTDGDCTRLCCPVW